MASGKSAAMPLWAIASRDKTHKLNPASLIKCFRENVTLGIRRRLRVTPVFLNQADRTSSIVSTTEEERLFTTIGVMSGTVMSSDEGTLRT